MCLCDLIKRIDIPNPFPVHLSDEHNRCITFLAMVLGLYFSFVGRPRVLIFFPSIVGGNLIRSGYLLRHFAIEGEVSTFCMYCIFYDRVCIGCLC